MAMAEIEPYSFEPMRDHSDSDEDLTENPDESRRGNTAWCSCERCENWSNQQERECLCCQEMEEAVTKMSGEILLCTKIIINMLSVSRSRCLIVVNFDRQLFNSLFSILGSDFETDHHPVRCITQHSSFSMICLQQEVLETAIVGLSQARGTTAPREMNNTYVS